MMTTLEANTKYVNLINHYKMFPPKDGEYFEVHHIVPRAIAPDLINEQTNLVKLPYHAHVLAHLYYANSLEDGDKNKYGQIYAVMRMLALQNKQQYISEEFILEHAEELDAAREKFRELVGIAHKGKTPWNKGKKQSDEAKKKNSEAQKGKHLSDETKRKLSLASSGENNGMFGKQHSDDSRKKISEALKGRKLSDEQKQKLREAFSGEKNPMFGKNAFEGKTEEEMAIIKQKMSASHKGKNKGKNPLEGKTEEEMIIFRQKSALSSKGKHWYHNPETNESNRFFECPAGWLPGRK